MSERATWGIQCRECPATLEPGIVALTYTIGKTRAFLYALHPPSTESSSGLSMFELTINDETVLAKGTAFRDAITGARDSRPYVKFETPS